MDVYHKVLVRLYEETGGKDSQPVEFRDLVRDMGFLGSYPDVFREMSRQGWIAETPRADVVNITHWGIKEAKKTASGDEDASENSKLVSREASKLQSNAKELAIIAGELTSDQTEDKFKQLSRKLSEINEGAETIKDNLG